MRFFLLCFLLFSSTLAGQTSGHPSDIAWKKILSKRANIIYPQGQKARAERIASYLDVMHESGISILNKKERKIDIVLQTNQVISNGYVSIAPFLSEFYATPPQDQNALGSLDWLDLLAIHEYRHVQQALTADVGITRLMHFLIGQGGWAVSKSLAVPNWFDEGDAVMAETKLTKAGRGRTPEFYVNQRAILNHRNKYPFMKARAGSYKDIVPNHYLLGYTILNYVESKHDEKIWSDVLKRAASYKSLLYPFSKSLKKYTGLGSRKSYNVAFDALDQKFKKQNGLKSFTTAKRLTAKFKTPTFYSFPQETKDGDIVAIKTSYKKTPVIVKIEGEKSKKVTSMGISANRFISVRNNNILWTEYSTDARWSLRSYSDIIMYDLEKQKKRKITSKGKFFSPDLNPNENKVVAAYFDESVTAAIAVIDVRDGTKELWTPHENGFVAYPKWVNNEEILFLLKVDSKLAFWKIKWSTKQATQLTNWTRHILNQPFVRNNKVVYSTSIDGVDNIYSFDLENPKKHKKITEVLNGAYSPSFTNEGDLLYSEVVFNGKQVSKSKFEVLRDYTFSTEEPSFVSIRNQSNQISTMIVADSLEEHDYRRMGRTQLHSWFVTSGLPTPGYEIIFENILSNFGGTLGGTYNRNENQFSGTGKLTFSAAYPVFDIEGARSGRTLQYMDSENVERKTKFIENVIGLRARLPFQFVKGNYNRNLDFGISSSLRNFNNVDRELLALTSIGDLGLNIRWRNARRRARQNVGTRLGQDLAVTYKTGILNTKTNVWNARGRVFLPGLFANHRIILGGEIQSNENEGFYRFSDVFRYSRGFTYRQNEGARRMSLEYGLPLFYPDFGIASIVYFKRVRANLFVDYTEIKSDQAWSKNKAFGAEIFFDNIYLNEFATSTGIRLGQNVEGEQKKFIFNIIMEYDF